ncbi:hypothetical protein F5X97DRAFT_339956 [Nemania serpens]|nr:hypothetical protein F5X97DRAFT_339956 [Nemania serpens]
MNVEIPRPDWLFDRSYRWPAFKFGMALDELFTTLHDKYNTWPCPLQDWEAFHHDVWEMSQTATTKEELMSNVESRMKTRAEEMAKAWDLICVHLSHGRSSLPEAHWRAGCQLFKTKSLDSLLAFLFEFLTSDEKKVVTDLRNELFPNSVQMPSDGAKPHAATSSPGEQGSSSPSRWSESQQYDGGPLLPSVSPTPPPQSDLPRLVTPETRQRTKSDSRSPLASTSASAPGNARKGNTGHQKPCNRITKKRAAPVRSSPHNTRQRAAKEAAAPPRYNLRPRPPREAK